MMQIRCALAPFFMINIVKKGLQIDASLYTLLQILSVSASEKTDLTRAFQGDEFESILPDSANHLNLLGIRPDTTDNARIWSR